MEKHVRFNLIILDESGSMSDCLRATIDGCNETLDVVRNFQKENADTIDSFVSIYAFHGWWEHGSRYIYKNVLASEVPDITSEDYRPSGSTPLLDSIGRTLTDLESVAKTHHLPSAVVTIITDGLENASRTYTYESVATIIDRLKELGWTFNFIGANIDEIAESRKLHIDNHMSFRSDEGGTRHMFNRLRNITNRDAIGLDKFIREEANMSEAEIIARRKERARNYLSEDPGELTDDSPF